MATVPSARKLLKSARALSGEAAAENPDVLARKLLKAPARRYNLKSRQTPWALLQDLGSDAALKRAVKSVAQARSAGELAAVLNAAAADGWIECGAVIARRFDRELLRVTSRVPSKEQFLKIEALCSAAGALKIQLDAPALRRMLKHSSARLRTLAAQYAEKIKRVDLQQELLSLAGERGPGAVAASNLLLELGDAYCAAALWPRALAARKSGNQRLLRQHLHLLGAFGAFDILIALKVWIEEDFNKSEAAGWCLAESWCALVRAKLAAGDSDRADSLDQLRWFLHVAERHAIPELNFDGEGVFHLARAFALLGAADDAENLARRAAKRSLPNAEHFPELLELTRRALNGPAPTAWLAACGDLDAQRKVVENWPVLLREGRKPVNWDLRGKLNAAVLHDALGEALNAPAPAAVRRVLKFICGDESASAVRDEIEQLAATHTSEVVRWKAARVAHLAQLARASSDATAAHLKTAQRWTRLDAAVLTGALKKIGEPKRIAPKIEARCAGVFPPERKGLGWKLDFENCRPKERALIVQSLLKAPLSRFLHRRAPLGPAYEERPDVRDVLELAPASGSLDEHMIEMARAVMEFWVYGEEPLTLDLHGVTQIAAFLSTAGVSMDDDDVMACGVFMGEAMRKRMGGEWSGFDGQYQLHIFGLALDPTGLARKIFERKDPYQGTVAASEMYMSAQARQPVQHKNTPARDTGASFERAIRALCELPSDAPMTALMAETRVFSYRMEPADWASVLSASDTLLENQSGARIAAAVAIYAPGGELARAWARWGARKRDASGLPGFIAEAMKTAAERDDFEAMPEWTVQVPATRFSFMNALRKKMKSADWKKTLLLLLRQRASVGDVAGVGWCLFSYKFEHRDCLPLIAACCEMSVSSRQTLLRATRHCTRDEVKLFRPVWAEGLRDPSPAVALAALDAVVFNRARSLKPLVQSLKHDAREEVASMAHVVLDSFRAV